MESSGLWKRTLAAAINDTDTVDRERLRDALRKFRSRVSDLVDSIAHELPGLTVHDITHLDALWDVADEVLGLDYPINPAEAFVLGGAILLHDAAHAVAAYEGGLSEIKSSSEWRDFIALRLNAVEPATGSPEEKVALFHVLRQLHAHQAEKLPWVSWKDAAGNPAFLIEDAELRNYFGCAIGMVAASHHWDVGMVPERLTPQTLTPAGFLKSSKWPVDVLKLAMIMRVIDAAHIDSRRAPWFLFALSDPDGISRDHWKFQGKIGKVIRNGNHELVISGSPFGVQDEAAWWLAFDTASMIDAEVKGARRVLAECSRAQLPILGVAGIHSASSFAGHLPVSGWVPVDVHPKIGDVPRLIERLGGSALYGDNPSVAVRELLQNAIDACTAYGALVSPTGRYVEVELVRKSFEEWVLSIKDNGVGMSKFVLTSVLIDFGRSLWGSSDLIVELPGLASSGFNSGGKFGIGFFSVFMLGSTVDVRTRRFDKIDSDPSDQWMLSFKNGLRSRPSLYIPKGAQRLHEPGTQVSVAISNGMLLRVLGVTESVFNKSNVSELLCNLIRQLAPASPFDIRVSAPDATLTAVVGEDWQSISDNELLSRFTNKSLKLWELTSSDGKLLGRLRPDSGYSSNAIGIVRGIAAARYTGLCGIVHVAENNSDARRSEAPPHLIFEDWHRWAEEIIAEAPVLGVNEWVALNSLCPNEDLPVWGLRGEDMTLAILRERIADLEELVVHVGVISHEDDDDMSSWRFERDLRLYSNVIIAPDSSRIGAPGLFIWAGDKKGFPNFLGLEGVNYMDQLRAALTEVWGGYEELEDEVVELGVVGGAEISRSCTVFVKGDATD